MRTLAILLTAFIIGFAGNASADQKIRLAQTSAVTTCMMTCNSAFANCNSSCVSTGTLPQGTLTTNLNAAAGNLFATGSCTSSCTNQQLSCQIKCASTAPSHWSDDSSEVRRIERPQQQFRQLWRCWPPNERYLRSAVSPQIDPDAARNRWL